ncbi:hypothetical protein IGI04_009700 [Brassica rapa subsp. trilocularis]|uniref:Uncharacterized protein n=1 Tax=Brassica rapa subsp. trilocularis TaxID=1813537 RepID=A0ABQ7N0D3_BRACM|nr:hypothetical protein IGI04_009700 [Brassica rapa subsp. trilocularis]
MKTVTGSVNSAKPISLAKAATLLSGFVSSETQASQDVTAYLRRASAAFTELRSFHREIRSANPKSELQELGGAKGIDDLVENETVTGEESVHGRKQDEIKEVKKKRKENNEEDVVEEKVMVKLEDEQRNKERKKKKSKYENVIDEMVNVKLEEDRKERKSKKNKKEDVIDEKLEEERKSKKKRKLPKETDA